jgi:hypothetical protein
VLEQCLRRGAQDLDAAAKSFLVKSSLVDSVRVGHLAYLEQRPDTHTVGRTISLLTVLQSWSAAVHRSLRVGISTGFHVMPFMTRGIARPGGQCCISSLSVLSIRFEHARNTGDAFAGFASGSGREGSCA